MDSEILAAKEQLDFALTVYGIAVRDKCNDLIIDFLDKEVTKASNTLSRLLAPSPVERVLEAFGFGSKKPLLPLTVTAKALPLWSVKSED